VAVRIWKGEKPVKFTDRPDIHPTEIRLRTLSSARRGKLNRLLAMLKHQVKEEA